MLGYPVLEIRRLMRAGANCRWAERHVTATLGVQLDEATKLVEELLEEGFIEGHRDGLRYGLTMKGRALAMAGARPIKRSTAERLVSNFLQRVEEVNADPNLLFWIDEVLVFGSFLTESETLGDVGLGLMYTRRNENPKDWGALSEARVKGAEANGRNFRNIFDEWGWPEREIELRLRKRSGSLSLHNLDGERTFIESLPHRQIYLRRNVTATSGTDQ